MVVDVFSVVSAFIELKSFCFVLVGIEFVLVGCVSIWYLFISAVVVYWVIIRFEDNFGCGVRNGGSLV